MLELPQTCRICCRLMARCSKSKSLIGKRFCERRRYRPIWSKPLLPSDRDRRWRNDALGLVRCLGKRPGFAFPRRALARRALGRHLLADAFLRRRNIRVGRRLACLPTGAFSSDIRGTRRSILSHGCPSRASFSASLCPMRGGIAVNRVNQNTTLPATLFANP